MWDMWRIINYVNINKWRSQEPRHQLYGNYCTNIMCLLWTSDRGCGLCRLWRHHPWVDARGTAYLSHFARIVFFRFLTTGIKDPAHWGVYIYIYIYIYIYYQMYRYKGGTIRKVLYICVYIDLCIYSYIIWLLTNWNHVYIYRRMTAVSNIAAVEFAGYFGVRFCRLQTLNDYGRHIYCSPRTLINNIVQPIVCVWLFILLTHLYTHSLNKVKTYKQLITTWGQMTVLWLWWKWEILSLEQELNPHFWHSRPVCYHYTT